MEYWGKGDITKNGVIDIDEGATRRSAKGTFRSGLHAAIDVEFPFDSFKS